MWVIKSTLELGRENNHAGSRAETGRRDHGATHTSHLSQRDLYLRVPLFLTSHRPAQDIQGPGRAMLALPKHQEVEAPEPGGSSVRHEAPSAGSSLRVWAQRPQSEMRSSSFLRLESMARVAPGGPHTRAPSGHSPCPVGLTCYSLRIQEPVLSREEHRGLRPGHGN